MVSMSVALWTLPQQKISSEKCFIFFYFFNSCSLVRLLSVVLQNIQTSDWLSRKMVKFSKVAYFYSSTFKFPWMCFYSGQILQPCLWKKCKSKRWRQFCLYNLSYKFASLLFYTKIHIRSCSITLLKYCKFCQCQLNLISSPCKQLIHCTVSWEQEPFHTFVSFVQKKKLSHLLIILTS